MREMIKMSMKCYRCGSWNCLERVDVNGKPYMQCMVCNTIWKPITEKRV